MNVEYDLRFHKPHKITNQLGVLTENTYDDYGNLKNIVYIDESKETFTYDTQGNMLTSQDGEGKTTSYGKLRSGTITNIPQRLAGMIWDNEAELYYVRERWYSPLEGRFISQDPIGLRGGLHQYNYARNNPINFSDPYGLEALADIWDVILWWEEFIIDWNNSNNKGKARYWNSWEQRWEWGPSFDSYDIEYAWDGDGRLWRNPNYLPPDSPARPENWPTPSKYIPPEDWRPWMMFDGGMCPTFTQTIWPCLT